MPVTSLATWNVNSIAARLPLVTRWVESRRPDVLCLQEIKCIDEKFPTATFANLGYTSLVYGQPTYNGVATLVRNELADQIEDVQKGFPGEDQVAARRFLAATIAGTRVINVYIPNGQAVGSDKYAYKLEWLGLLRSYFGLYGDPARPLALCGDFNVAPQPIDVHDPAQWEGKVLFSQPERAAMEAVREWGLTDAFRQLNPTANLFSWWDYRMNSFVRNLGVRIDHIWLTASLFAVCQEVKIDVEPRRWERPSDHVPVLARFGPVLPSE